MLRTAVAMLFFAWRCLNGGATIAKSVFLWALALRVAKVATYDKWLLLQFVPQIAVALVFIARRPMAKALSPIADSGRVLQGF